MSSTNHGRNREIQQDARAWANFSGCKYTAAQRQLTSPLAQGHLGPRVNARDLIAVLDQHPLLGSVDGDLTLGENGLHDDEWTFNGKTDLAELALVVDALRMFTPASARTSQVDSYRLKHTIENLLSPHVPYVSNGRLIWAAAALGLDLADDNGGPNAYIGISEREHHYVRRMVDSGGRPPRGDQHRPAGLTHLLETLNRLAAGQPAAPRWARPAPAPVAAPFHEWLVAQAGRKDPVGHLAYDYQAGVNDSDHGVAHNPGELLTILHDMAADLAAYEAGVAAIAEWFATNPGEDPVRTQLISSEVREVGFGEAAGDTELLRYQCPCGAGTIIEEHDNIPGHRSHDVRISCTRCTDDWRLSTSRGVRNWGLLPA